MYIKKYVKWLNTSFNSFICLVKVGPLYFKNMKETNRRFQIIVYHKVFHIEQLANTFKGDRNCLLIVLQHSKFRNLVYNVHNVFQSGKLAKNKRLPRSERWSSSSQVWSRNLITVNQFTCLNSRQLRLLYIVVSVINLQDNCVDVFLTVTLYALHFIFVFRNIWEQEFYYSSIIFSK